MFVAAALAPIVAAAVIAMPAGTGAVLTAIGTPPPAGPADDAATPRPVAGVEATEVAAAGDPGASAAAVGARGDVAGDGGGSTGPGPNGDTGGPPDAGAALPSSPANPTDAPAEPPSPAPPAPQTPPVEPPMPTTPPTPAPNPTPTPPAPTDDGAPRVAFSVSVEDLTARFANRTKGAVSWTWHFGDGETSTARNPRHTYGAPGTYTVILVAVAGDGSSASLTETISVGG